MRVRDSINYKYARRDFNLLVKMNDTHTRALASIYYYMQSTLDIAKDRFNIVIENLDSIKERVFSKNVK